MHDADHSAGKDTYSIEVISRSSQIEALGECVGNLVGFEAGQLFSPRFFLASIVEKTWTPRVIVVRRSGATIGIVYAKERKLAGIRTGLINADATLGAMIISEERERATVWERALSHLLTSSSVNGLRIHVPREGYELAATQRVLRSTGADFSCAETRGHAVLSLPRTYDTFLSRLGSTTRRNFRYYRRHFEMAGHVYVEDLPVSEFRRAAVHLVQRSSIESSRESVERVLRMACGADRPLLAGLQTRNGEWLGIVGGWYDGDHATMILQMNNDREHRTDSLSVVLRGYLIESLIARGIEDLFFWGGAGGPLARYCHWIPTASWHLDRPTRRWRVFRSLLRLVSKFLPGKMEDSVLP